MLFHSCSFHLHNPGTSSSFSLFCVDAHASATVAFILPTALLISPDVFGLSINFIRSRGENLSTWSKFFWRELGLRLARRKSPGFLDLFNVVGTSRCDVRAACSGATPWIANASRHSFRPLLRGRDGAARHPYHRAEQIPALFA